MRLEGMRTSFHIDLNKNIYAEPNKFEVDNVYVREIHEDGESMYGMKIKDSKITNQNKTIVIGDEKKSEVSIEELVRGESVSIDVKLVDEYGNEKDSYIEEKYILKSKDGKINKEIKYNVPMDIPKGLYTLDIVCKDGYYNEFTITKDNVRVMDSSELIYDFNANYASYELLDGDKLLDGKINHKGNASLIVDGGITEGKKYQFNRMLVDNSYGIYEVEHTMGDLTKYSNSLGFGYDYPTASYKLENNIKALSIYNKNGLKLENMDTKDYETIDLELMKGLSYKIEAITETERGIELISSEFVAGESSEIVFNNNNLKKVTVGNSINKDVDFNNIKIKTATGVEYSTGNLDRNKGLYLPAGDYDMTIDAMFKDLGVIEYSKKAKITNADVNINIGENISYELSIDKETYNSKEEISASVVSIKDNEGVGKTVFKNQLDNIKIDLMHGDTTIATFDKVLPDTISGETYVKVSGDNKFFGNIKSNNILVTVKNTKPIQIGDIDLNEYVDIYDLIYIAKDYGLKKGDALYDPRINLDSSNNLIDITDLANAAINYSEF